jgi:hypothetical protein
VKTLNLTLHVIYESKHWAIIEREETIKIYSCKDNNTQNENLHHVQQGCGVRVMELESEGILGGVGVGTFLPTPTSI